MIELITMAREPVAQAVVLLLSLQALVLVVVKGLSRSTLYRNY